MTYKEVKETCVRLHDLFASLPQDKTITLNGVEFKVKLFVIVNKDRQDVEVRVCSDTSLEYSPLSTLKLYVALLDRIEQFKEGKIDWSDI